MIRMVVGLGNPPRKYQDTRHNLGYKVLDLLLENFKLKLKAGRGDYYFAATEIDNREIYLVKPSIYMNDSGLPVLQAVEKFGINPEELIAICDDFNLPLGKIRIRERGSEGGHKGLRSMIYHLNSQEFPRVRLGIGSPPAGVPAEEYVLEKFNLEEKKFVNEMLDRASQAAMTALSLGIKESMQKFN
ncbi:MAG TPA: aminoacyl-tRNA hydrolase [candidate division Zixibacteria bacterium]|nr:aminoacyl-tRNA hydrolase [candidate division Zixibacteria bacterium]